MPGRLLIYLHINCNAMNEDYRMQCVRKYGERVIRPVRIVRGFFSLVLLLFGTMMFFAPASAGAVNVGGVILTMALGCVFIYFGLLLGGKVFGKSRNGGAVTLGPITLTAPMARMSEALGVWHSTVLPGMRFSVDYRLLRPFELLAENDKLAMAQFREGACIPKGLPVTIVNGDPCIIMDLSSLHFRKKIVEAVNARINACAGLTPAAPQLAPVFEVKKANPKAETRFRYVSVSDLSIAVVMLFVGLFCVLQGPFAVRQNGWLYFVMMLIGGIVCLGVGALYLQFAFSSYKSANRASVSNGVLSVNAAIVEELNSRTFECRRTAVALNDITVLEPYAVYGRKAGQEEHAAVARLKNTRDGRAAYLFIPEVNVGNLSRFIAEVNALIQDGRD